MCVTTRFLTCLQHGVLNVLSVLFCMQGKVDPTVLFCGEAAIEAVAATSESKRAASVLLNCRAL
jgi:hypothetical protein